MEVRKTCLYTVLLSLFAAAPVTLYAQSQSEAPAGQPTARATTTFYRANCGRERP